MKVIKEILIFANTAGNQPFKKWLESLDSTVRSRITNRILRLSLGNYGDYKSLGKGLIELRFHFGSGYRVYFAEDGEKIVLLINGGNKKTQKKNIQLAIEYLNEYFNNKVQ
jgi:putative addiction module killer protein